MMDDMAPDVASDMKVKRVCPKIKYTGNGSMVPRNTNENTMLRTIIMSSGFRTDQAIPSTLRRYLSLKSFETRDASINQSRFNCMFGVFMGWRYLSFILLS